uniref:Uncharacterized protein n=1 Tax=Rhipicephalus microplus TaxID=6941 RepID=A0A6G5A438_RHIMP
MSLSMLNVRSKVQYLLHIVCLTAVTAVLLMMYTFPLARHTQILKGHLIKIAIYFRLKAQCVKTYTRIILSTAVAYLPRN